MPLDHHEADGEDHCDDEDTNDDEDGSLISNDSDRNSDDKR